MKNTTRSFLLSATLLLSTILFSCGGASPDYMVYQNKVNSQMLDMINVLNAGHYNQFLSSYASPAYINSMGGVDKALLQFGNARQQALYKALKSAANITPLYDDKAKTLTYISTNLPKPVTFKLVNGTWYLTDDWFK